MLQFNPSDRPSLDQIQQSKWMQGDLPSKNEVSRVMNNRFNQIDVSKFFKKDIDVRDFMDLDQKKKEEPSQGLKTQAQEVMV